MNEAEFKSDMMKWLRKHPGKPLALRHEDKLTSGIPDISVTALGRTLWVEAKLYTKNGIIERDIQVTTLADLDDRGLALYAIYNLDLDYIELVRPTLRDSGKSLFLPGYNPRLAAHMMMRYIAKWPSYPIETFTAGFTPHTV